MAKKKTKKKAFANLNIYNVLIVALAIIVIGFIYSFAQKSWSNGVAIPSPQLSSQQKEQLGSAIDLFEANPIIDIKVEVLNGCGEKGLAGKISDFLREEHIDVIRSENADNFDYEKTMIIQRSVNLYNIKTMAKVMAFNVDNDQQVQIQPNPNADVDVTVILGKDYSSVKPIKVYLANLQ